MSYDATNPLIYPIEAVIDRFATTAARRLYVGPTSVHCTVQ